ncbi:MAG TPA: hypothetical protein VMZ53_32470 [Kofleriaceae bacterium]|nr:hypothetical protein [Kofleriaceae bacterium]
MTRDRDRDITRRALIQWGVAAGAALGVSKSRLAEIFERTGDKQLAHAASSAPTKRSVHIRAGNGGLAWFTLLWPHNDIAAAAPNNPVTTWPHAPAVTRKLTGTGGQLTVGPNTPFVGLEGDTATVTAFMAGNNEAHVQNPNSIARSLNGNSMFAIASVLQQASPTVIPVITVDDVALGTAPGSPRAAVVPTGLDIVGLFNSAASRAGGLLERAKYAGHADLYRSHFETLAQLNRASGRSTTRDSYATARSAAGFLGQNLAAKLAVQPADEIAYGIKNADGTPSTMRQEVVAIARTLIVTAKAFQLHLTSSVVLPGVRDDPHDAFTNTAKANTARDLKTVLDAFMRDLKNRNDDATGAPLSEDIVITIEGDTPKTPLDRTNWLDDTPGNSNWMYVYSGGLIKTGWLGGIDRNRGVKGFDPATGAPTPYDGDLGAQAAVAAVAYAITKGDKRRVQDFSRVDISGIVNAV